MAIAGRWNRSSPPWYENSYVRQAAAEALGQIGDSRAVEPLIAALRDKGSDVRLAAAEALGRIGDSQAVEALTATLGDENRNVRRVAAEALAKIDPGWVRSEAARQQVPEFIDALRYGYTAPQAAAKMLGRIGDSRAVEPLIAALRNENSDVRRVAAEALTKIDPGWARSEAARQQVPKFLDALRQGWGMRQTAAQVLERIGDSRVVEALIHTLGYRDSDVRQTAAETLMAIGMPAVDLLTTALRDGNRAVCQAAAEVLAKIDPDWARSEAVRQRVPEFIAALREWNWEVRREAAEALEQIGDSQAVEALIDTLRDENSDVRQAAAEALAKIDPDWARSEAARQQVRELIAALQDGNWVVRQEAAQALGQIGDCRAAEPLIAALQGTLQDRDKYVHQALSNSLEKIRQANQRLLPHHQHLFCQPCGLRVTLLKISSGLLTKEHFVVCRGCNSSLGLLLGVREVKGLISSDGETLRQDGETVLIPLWSETDKAARNADIDCLLIQAGKVENYDQAVNAVTHILKSDASRPAKWCKQIPVILQGNPPLSQGTLNMLKDTFKEVRAE